MIAAAARRKFVVGNWKMNGLASDLDHLAQIDRRLADHDMVTAAVCPPFTLIGEAARRVDRLEVGAQDCHAKANGAHTGFVSAAMVKCAGAKLVILGHSERRVEAGERSPDVRAKALAAIDAGLKVIVCVGERQADRDVDQAIPTVLNQLMSSVPYGANSSDLIVAYEPTWAIGTGRTPTAADIKEMHSAIRDGLLELSAEGDLVRILYGGSVSATNAADIFAIANVDGALVGGASLTADKFIPIVAAAQRAAATAVHPC